MSEVLQVPHAMVRDVWHLAQPLLAEPIAMTNGRFLPEDVRDLCAAGGCQLWMITEGNDVLAAVVTELVNYPRRRVARVVFAGGKQAREWHAGLEAALEAWARQWGCSGLEAFGRKGWARLIHADQAAVMIMRDFAPAQNAETTEGVH